MSSKWFYDGLPLPALFAVVAIMQLFAFGAFA